MVVLTADSSLRSAIEALKAGAEDDLAKRDAVVEAARHHCAGLPPWTELDDALSDLNEKE